MAPILRSLLTGLGCAVLTATGPLVDPPVLGAQHQVSVGYARIGPRGDLDRNIDAGNGFVAGYARRLTPNRTMALGASFAIADYGRTEFSVPLPAGEEETELDLFTGNSVYLVLGELQLRARTRVARPYLHGNAGYVRFETMTARDSDGPYGGGLGHVDQSDGTWIWGGGGGVLLQLYQGRHATDEWGAGRAHLDFGVRYLRGGRVKYLKPGSPLTEDGRFDLDRHLAESQFETLTYQIGVVFDF